MLLGKNVLIKFLQYFCNIFVIFLLFVNISFASGGTIEQDIEKVKKKAKEMKIPEFKENKEINEKAKKSYEFSQSNEFKAQVERFKKDLNILMGKELPPQMNTVEQYYSAYKPQTGILSDRERIYIFISSSIPEKTIKAFLRDADNIGNNVYFVLRGGINGLKQLMPTLIWANNLLKKDSFCEGQCETYRTKILIDPFLFRKYDIKKVPAVVYVNGIHNPEGLSEGLNSVRVNSFWVSYGDVSLEYHLKLISEKSGKNFFFKSSY